MKSRKEFIREATQDGWTCKRSRRGGHYKCTHPAASAPAFVPCTPGDRRGVRNDRALLKRLLRDD